MKRLVKYFIISLICNIAILVFLFLQDKGPDSQNTNGNKSKKGVSLLPANFLPDFDEKGINDSLNNRKYRPVEVTKENKKSAKNHQEHKLVEDKHIKTKEIVEIPDLDRKEKQFMTLDEYEKYKNSLPLEGTIVTEMRVNFPEDVTERTMREIISFFGFKIVAYPSHNPDYLLVCKAPEFKFEKLNTRDKLQEFYSNNSNRTIEPEKGLLYWAKSELARQGIDADSLRISIVLGNSAGYFHWKEKLAIKNASKPVTDVSYTEARVSKTPQGYWILLIEGVYLKDGQYLKVKDQELKDILL